MSIVFPKKSIYGGDEQTGDVRWVMKLKYTLKPLQK